MPAIWPEILTGPGGLDADHVNPNLTDPAQSRYVYQMHDGHTIATYSWERLLAVLQAAMEAAAETDNLEDLAQIRGLVSWRTRIGWTPLLPGDLPVRAGRQLAALIPTLGAAAEAYSVANPPAARATSAPAATSPHPAGRAAGSACGSPGGPTTESALSGSR